MSEIHLKLFSNSYKKKNSKKQPDYIAYLSETEKDLKRIGAMWKRISKSGFLYYSLILESGLLNAEHGELSLTRKKEPSKLKLRKGKVGKK